MNWLRVTKWKVATIFVVLIVALVVDVFNLNVLGYDITLHKGLDIVGGSELTIAICQGPDQPVDADPTCRSGPRNGISIAQAQTDTIPVLQNRVNSLGVSEASVQPVGSDQISIELPGVSLAKADSILGTTALIHFASAASGAPPTAAAKNSDYCIQNPTDGFCVDQDDLFQSSQLANAQFYPSGYHWKIDNNLPAADIVSSALGTDSSGNPAVDITFNSAGGNEWNKITSAAYTVYADNGCSSGAACPAPSMVAIFLDTQVISAPVVEGASSTSTEITGLSLAEAQSLQSQINSGALPAEIGVVEHDTVGATLGSQTVTATLLAGAVGLLVVILFMIGYYRFPGVLASIALILYSIMNLAAYKILGVTVSLAGLAGFVLSVGMAVDANVLIFERTRDELRHGRSVGAAIELGFRRAFPAIRDSNISTEIVCVILAVFGSDIVKGFAITLGIGVAISFFSAVLITQSLLGVMLRWRVGRNPSLYTEIHPEYQEQHRTGRFDIVRNRNWFFLASLAIIIPGIVAIIGWGFRLGIDFAGGDQIQAGYMTPVTSAQLVSTVNKAVPGLQPTVQSFGKIKGYDTYLIQTLPTGEVETIYNALDAAYHFAPGTESVNTVGQTIASSAVSQAVLLVLASSLMIAFYLAYQFGKQRQVNRWRFAACTFFKLLHDIFVLAGIWAILGHFTSLGQVDNYFITAVLTGVAFSIHDTIVVFDRIRENLRVGPRFTFDQIVNLSTVQTMARSLNTSLTVVFVLLALVLFGGASIQGFVLALLIGIITGTYSSIFNASTLLVAWNKARPEKTAGRAQRGVVARPARAS
ncbi:MAG: protein translocase subunit SecD [Candidatus Dormibacteria bacterium]